MSLTPGRLAMMSFAAWLGTCALVLLASQMSSWRPPDPIPPEIGTPTAPSQPMPKPRETPLIALERPLFWETRRPESTVAIEPPKEEPMKLPKDARLVGVFGSGQDAGVLVMMGERTQRIPLGGKWEGWTLKRITEDSVVLDPSRGNEVELPLRPLSVGPKGEPLRTRHPAIGKPTPTQEADQAPAPPQPATTPPSK